MLHDNHSCAQNLSFRGNALPTYFVSGDYKHAAGAASQTEKVLRIKRHGSGVWFTPRKAKAGQRNEGLGLAIGRGDDRLFCTMQGPAFRHEDARGIRLGRFRMD